MKSKWTLKDTTDFLFLCLCLVLVLTLSTCGVKRQVEPRPMELIRGDGWTAVETKPGFFVIAARTNQGEANAVKTLCNHSYVCLGPESAGRLITVERVRK